MNRREVFGHVNATSRTTLLDSQAVYGEAYYVDGEEGATEEGPQTA